MKLFCSRGELGPADSKSLRLLEFEVPPGTGALRVDFDFAPIFSEDAEQNRASMERAVREYLGERAGCPEAFAEMLAREDIARYLARIRNLLNWLVYDPAGRCRGRWDFRADGSWQTSTIGPQASSPGFTDGPVLPGRWSIVLEAHLICTPRCRYALEVQRCESDDLPELAPNRPRPRRLTGSSAASPRPEARQGWLRGEMHAHSMHSDGAYLVSELAARAAAAGLDFVALTDHNTTSGCAEAARCEEPVFIRAEELTTFCGHFCLYGTGRTVEWHRAGERIRIERIADEVRAEGVLFSLAHPFQIGDPFCTGCRWPGQDPPADRFDLVEIWSGCWQARGVEIRRAIDLWDRLWDRGLRPVGVAGRDWHDERQADGPGRRFARTVVAAKERSERALLEGLRRGAVYLSTGPHLDLRILAEAGPVDLDRGAEPLRLPAGGEAAVEAALEGEIPEGALFRLVRDGHVAREVPASATLHMPVRGPGRYRAEVWSADGEPLLLSNHLLVEEA
ncbi:MAG: PHP domain-containing protein [Deltaproteobacteria bacterium]|nr:PHP domain-containing protein [Deltaproteobacteria bacterium]